MEKNIITILAFVVLALTSCKKEDKGYAPPPPNLSKTLEIKATANANMMIGYIILRPTGLTSGVTGSPVDSFGSENVPSPFQYKNTDVQSGDKILVQVYCYTKDGFNATLKLDGVEQQTTSTTEAKGEVPANLTWYFTVKWF